MTEYLPWACSNKFPAKEGGRILYGKWRTLLFKHFQKQAGIPISLGG